MDQSPINISAHVPVEVFTKIKSPAICSVNPRYDKKPILNKLLWKDIDAEKYNISLNQDISNMPSYKSTSEQLAFVTNKIHKAASTAVPTKPIKLKGPKWKASPKVKGHLKSCKVLYSKWKSLGKPLGHDIYTELKIAKKRLRSTQRIEKALDRKSLYQKIMENPSSDLFYRLINRNRKSNRRNVTSMEINGKLDYSTENQRSAFVHYYEDLNIPKENGFDNSYLDLCNIRQNLVEKVYRSSQSTIEPYTEEDISKSIEKLNCGKSPDEFGICAEHLIFGKGSIVPILTQLFNKILKERIIPPEFKVGVLTPVIKKDKNPTLVNSYRGITVTPIIGKLHELCILRKLNLHSDSELQFGFTEGLCPLMASIIITEAKCEMSLNRTRRVPAVLATVDVQSAFDVVQHTILFDKLLDQNVHPDMWLLIKDLYTGMSSRVKWNGDLSSKFEIQQGVRQGGILSTHFYKLFVQDLLNELEKNSVGFQLGNIYIGTPTCADDLALIGKSAGEMQQMLNIVDRYAAQHHYNLHPTKTNIIELNKCDATENHYTVSGNQLKSVKTTTHLGLKRMDKAESEKNVDDRIQLARRTKYSLMSSGMHGTNGIDPVTSYTIYKVYVLPRLLYGLEAIHLTCSDLQKLDKFHKQTLRAIQSLPQRTSISAVYLLVGAMPIEAELHKRQLSLLYLLLATENSKIKDILQRQISVNFDNRNSFFYQCLKILNLYNLPDIYKLQNSLPSKLSWKSMVKKAIQEHWNSTLLHDISNQSSLKYLSKEGLGIGLQHNVYKSVDPNLLDVRKCMVKTRMLTRTYTLQDDRHKFSCYEVEPTCPLCTNEIEDLPHMLTTCSALREVRFKHYLSIKSMIINLIGESKWKENFNTKFEIAKLLIDCTNFKALFDEMCMLKLETMTRNMCYALHQKRLLLLAT